MTATYEQDLHAWAIDNAALLRQGRSTEADLENIAARWNVYCATTPACKPALPTS